MIFQAHKGVSTENPENTMPAFEAAVDQGYGIIELDVGVTKDLRFVLLHDDEINRTARFRDGRILPEKIRINDLTYEEALAYDYGVWFSEKFKNTPIPLLDDVLKLSRNSGIKLKIDNKYQRFDTRQKAAFFDLIKDYEDVSCLTCNTIDAVVEVSAIFKNMQFHYDGPVSRENLDALSKILPRERLTVWLPYKNRHTQWAKVPFADNSLADMVREYASLGIWLLSDYTELDAAERLGASVIETNGHLKPPMQQGVFADMHTHSVSSHDSVCAIEDMCCAQIVKGSAVMAVTDHCDVMSFQDYDVFTPIMDAYNTVQTLKETYQDRCKLLSGVEIGEGIHYPDACEKIHDLCPYDVIVGSVHIVKYKEITAPYSKIDFSTLSKEDIDGYLDAYFDDILTMLDTLDMDVLAHLTCPLRYITGKYGILVDLDRFMEKITAIFKKIIRSGIALEVNTSSFKMLCDTMPGEALLKQYHEMGGYLITLGSDAHHPDGASASFREAAAMLKRNGFHHIFYYENRKSCQCSL